MAAIDNKQAEAQKARQDYEAMFAQLQAENARLKAQVTALASQPSRPVTLKVSEKGAISVYGINSRFPVTLYREQWDKLMSDDFMPNSRLFCKRTRGSLTRCQRTDAAKTLGK